MTVEFYRSKSSECMDDGSGNTIPSSAAQFPYGTNITCGLVCSVETGPYSPMRRGSADNIYIVPAPDKLTFSTATIFAAACCVPAILSLISLGSRIVRFQLTGFSGHKRKEESVDGVIKGTNGATVAKMNAINDLLKTFLNAAEIPVFAAAVFGIIALGEKNFFSAQVFQYTEPTASIGEL